MKIRVASFVPLVCLAIGLFSQTASAEQAAANSGYLTDQSGLIEIIGTRSR